MLDHIPPGLMAAAADPGIFIALRSAGLADVLISAFVGLQVERFISIPVVPPRCEIPRGMRVWHGK